MHALTWEELELPVLHWVLEHGDEGTGLLRYKTEERFAGIPSLVEPQVRDAIKVLEQAGLVVGPSSATTDYERWPWLRPTADGLRLLGEWPPTEAATVNSALAHILRALADREELSDSDRDATKRAATTVANTSGEVVLDVVKSEMTRLISGGGG